MKIVGIKGRDQKLTVGQQAFPIEVNVRDDQDMPAVNVPTVWKVVNGGVRITDQTPNTSLSSAIADDAVGQSLAEFICETPGPYEIHCIVGKGNDKARAKFRGTVSAKAEAPAAEPPAAETALPNVIVAPELLQTEPTVAPPPPEPETSSETPPPASEPPAPEVPATADAPVEDPLMSAETANWMKPDPAEAPTEQVKLDPGIQPKLWPVILVIGAAILLMIGSLTYLSGNMGRTATPEEQRSAIMKAARSASPIAAPSAAEQPKPVAIAAPAPTPAAADTYVCNDVQLSADGKRLVFTCEK